MKIHNTVVDWTLYVIEWIISQHKNKDTTTKYTPSIEYNVQLTTYAVGHPRFLWFNKPFFQCINIHLIWGIIPLYQVQETD